MDPEALLSDRDFVHALARTLIADPERADDAAQEALIITSAARPAPANPKSWLATIILNFYRSAMRSETRRAARERKIASPLGIPSAAEIVEREDVRRKVVLAVLALDEPYRSAILARYFNNLAPRQIAAELGIPVATVQTRLKRALQMLRSRLGRESLLALAPFAAIGPAPLAPTAMSTIGTLAAGGAVAMKGKSIFAVIVAALLLLGIFATTWPFPRETQTQDSTTVAKAVAPRSSPEIAAPAKPDAPPASRASVESPTPQIRGRVVDREGNAVANARIIAFEAGAKDTIRAEAPVAPVGSSGAPSDVTVSTADATGLFAITVGDRAPHYHILADRPGYAVGAAKNAKPGENVTIVADRYASISGFVRDRDGKPIPNATIQYRVIADRVSMARETKSATDGSYKLEGALPPIDLLSGIRKGITDQLFGSAPGFALTAIRLSRSQDYGDIAQDIHLTRGFSFRGRVVDAETNAPIPGARVFARGLDSNKTSAQNKKLEFAAAAYSLLDSQLGETTSGADGKFLLANMPSFGAFNVNDVNPLNGFAYVGAGAPGYVPCAVRFPRGIEDEGTGDIEIRCWSAGTIHGRIVDTEGKPVGNVIVWIKSRGIPGAENSWFYADVEPATHLQKANENGQFAIVAAAFHDKPNTIALKIDDNEFEPFETTVDVNTNKVTTVPDIVLTRSPRRTANIAVRDPNARPVWGASVRLGDESVARARTDREGRATIDIVSYRVGQPTPVDPFSKPLTFSAIALGVGSGSAEPIEIALGESKEVTITLKDPIVAEGNSKRGRVQGAKVSATARAPRETGGIIGIVKDAHSKRPILDFRVEVPNPERGYTGYGAGTNAGLGPGVFELKEIPVGSHRIHVRAEGFARKTIEGVEIRRGEITGPLEILIDRGVELRGAVVGNYGKEFPDKVECVEVDGEFETPIAFVNVVNRAFVVRKLVPGSRVQLYAVAGKETFFLLEGARKTEESLWEVPEGREIIEQEFKFTPAHKVTIKVSCPRLDGQTMTPSEAQAREAASKLTVRDSAGSVAFAHSRSIIRSFDLWFRDGNYDIRVELPGAAPVERKVTISDAGAQTVELDIP